MERERERERERLLSLTQAEADEALSAARRDLDSALSAHDTARRSLLTRRVTELKGMLHRFCEQALKALGVGDAETGGSGGDLDRYNIYGDVNVESSLGKLRRGMASGTKSVSSSTSSVAMRLAHMKRHAATTFTTTKKAEDADTEEPAELELNEMALGK